MEHRANVDVSGGTLVVVGSANPVTRAQVERLADEGALVLTLHREAVLNQDETYLMGIRSGAAAAIKQGRNVVVRSENWPEAITVTRLLAAKRRIPAEEVEQRVSSMLARVGEGVVMAANPQGVIVVGTETGAALCRQLGISALAEVSQVVPGLPVMHSTEQGPLRLILKPGGFGGPDTLVEAISHLAALCPTTGS